MIIEGNSAKLVENVLVKAKDEVDSFLAMEAKIAEREILKAKNNASVYISEVEEKASKETDILLKKEITRLEIHATREFLKNKDNILEDVLLQGYLQLKTIRDHKNYSEILKRWILEGMNVLGSQDIIVECCQYDKDIVSQLFPRINIEIKEDSFIGVIIKSKDGKSLFNNTVKARFARYKDELKTQIYEAIQGA